MLSLTVRPIRATTPARWDEAGWVLPFSEFLDYSSFSLSFTTADLPSLPMLLRGVSSDEMNRLRANGDAVYKKHFSTVQARAETVLRILRANHCGYRIPVFPDPCQPHFLSNNTHLLPLMS